jgi:hypothetical protein
MPYLALAFAAAYLIGGPSPSAVSASARPERTPQTTWAPCNRNAHTGGPSTFRPLSDRRAASLVTHQRETRRFNARSYTVDGRRYSAVNAYIPSASQLRDFVRSTTSDGRTVVQFNPYFRYVDGRDGLSRPSTDDLIQWAAHKWGIPEDWLRAEYVRESYWNAFHLGDGTTVNADWYRRYPPQARVPHGTKVYQSMGIAQIKWIPDGSVGPGSEPLRWESTAFNIDYQAAMVRFYYDNPRGARSSWGDRTYAPCQPWNSVGGWFEPYPWNNRGQENYVAEVRQDLSDRSWATGSFVAWTPSSFPPGVKPN